MSSPLMIDLFVEDRAHEAFLVPLTHRIASEDRISVVLQVRTARGGHSKAIEEFRAYQRFVEKGAVRGPSADLIVVGIDGNCATFQKKKREIKDATQPAFRDRVVSACPDPHIERWFLADPNSFYTIVGYRPEVGRKKCIRDHYKQTLSQAIRAGGHPTTLGGIEFANDLVSGMDLHQAEKNDSSFKAFVSDLRARLRGMATGGGCSGA